MGKIIKNDIYINDNAGRKLVNEDLLNLIKINKSGKPVLIFYAYDNDKNINTGGSGKFNIDLMYALIETINTKLNIMGRKK